MGNEASRLHMLVNSDIALRGMQSWFDPAGTPLRMSKRRCLAKLGCSGSGFQEAVSELYRLYLPGSKRTPTYRRLYREAERASLSERFAVDAALFEKAVGVSPGTRPVLHE